MQFFNNQYIQNWKRAQPRVGLTKISEAYVKNSMETLYENFSKRPAQAQRYDVFLSHRYEDKQYVRDLLGILYQKYKLTVYVDWIVHPELNRANVTKETADLIRRDLKKCKSLWFLTSSTSISSKWMPWETGFMDGYNGKVAICPYINEEQFKGSEYLSLYPYVRPAKVQNTDKECIAVHTDDACVTFESWINRK